MAGKRIADVGGTLRFETDKHQETACPLHESRDLRVDRAEDEVSLPMPRDGPIFRLRRALPDGDSIDYPSLLGFSCGTRPALPELRPGSQMCAQLFLEGEPLAWTRIVL